VFLAPIFQTSPASEVVMFANPAIPVQSGFVSMTNFNDSWLPQSPPQSPFTSPLGSPGFSDTMEPAGVKAVVKDEGYVSLCLDYGITIDIAPNQAICLSNKTHGTMMSLSGCGTQMAFCHPQGRVIQYHNRIEVQTKNDWNIRNAKIWPRGISFTSNQSALVYLVDPAGARYLLVTIVRMRFLLTFTEIQQSFNVGRRQTRSTISTRLTSPKLCLTSP